MKNKLILVFGDAKGRCPGFHIFPDGHQVRINLSNEYWIARAADRDGDAELKAYNARLSSLNDQDKLSSE